MKLKNEVDGRKNRKRKINRTVDRHWYEKRRMSELS